MTAAQFRRALTELGLKQVEFAELLRIGDRTVRFYANAGVTSMPVLILIRLLLDGRINTHDIEEVMK